MLIDDGYSVLVADRYWIRPLTRKEKRVLRKLLSEDKQEASHYLFDGRVTTKGGKEVIPDLLEQQSVAEALVSWNTEPSDTANLREGASLYFRHPRLAVRSCSLCKAWWFDEDTHRIVQIGGQNIRRPKHAAVACDTDAGCAKGHWRNPVELNAKNTLAFQYWLRHRATGCPKPGDAILANTWFWLEELAKRYGFGSAGATTRQPK